MKERGGWWGSGRETFLLRSASGDLYQLRLGSGSLRKGNPKLSLGKLPIGHSACRRGCPLDVSTLIFFSAASSVDSLNAESRSYQYTLVLPKEGLSE